MQEIKGPGRVRKIPVDDPRWAVVERVLSSRHFLKATQLRDFLTFIAARAIEDEAGELTEHQIGCEVLGRPHDYSTSDDNIVRVQARHLRRKLEEYFAEDGISEPIMIVIPKGAYIPRFEPRRHPPPEPPVPVVAAPTRWRPGPVALLIASCLAVAAIVFAITRPSGTSVAPPAAAASKPPFPWSLVFDRVRPTYIVVADTCLVMFQDLLGSDIRLSDYIGHDYPGNLLGRVASPELRSGLELLSSRQYTSLADLNISSRLLQMADRFGSRAMIRYARHLNIRDFKNNNFIIVGSRRGIPWVELFEDRLNFAFEQEEDGKAFHFRNRSPLPGEQPYYGTSANATGGQTTYAVVGMMPNSGHNGNVLLLSGITMEATEAAGELLNNADVPRLPAGSEFEVLIKTTSVAGASSAAEIVAQRVSSRGTGR